MTASFNTWPAVTWLWLIECTAFFFLLRWSWRRDVPGGNGYRGLLFASAVYVGMEAINLTLDASLARTMLSGLSFVAIGLVGPNLLVLFSEITGQKNWFPYAQRKYIFAAGVGLGILRFTDASFGLIFRTESVQPDHGFFLTVYEPGPAFSILMAGLLGALLVGAVLVGKTWRTASSLVRRQLGTLLASCCLPVATALSFNLGIHPFGWLDPTPFSLIATITLGTWTVFNKQLVEMVPLARNYLVDHFSEGILVVDTMRTVIDVNPAFRRMLNWGDTPVLGKPLSKVAGDWPLLVEICASNEPRQLEVQPRFGKEEVHWAVSWHPLSELPNTGPRGFLLVLSDISQQKHAANQLRELLAERTREWRRAADSALRSSEEEKRRLSLMLRETIIPSLNDLVGRARTVGSSRAPFDRDPATSAKIAALVQKISETSAKIEDYAELLDGSGLARHAFSQLLDKTLDQLQRIHKIYCHIDLAVDFPHPSRARCRHLLAIISEAVALSATQARATSATIVCAHRTDHDTITISNDGQLDSKNLSDHTALRQMRTRAGLLNGQLVFRTLAQGGFMVELTVPPEVAESEPGLFRV